MRSAKVILSFEVSHDSVTDRRSRLQDNIRSRGDDTLVFSERAFQTPKHSGGLQHGQFDISGIRTRLLSFRPEWNKNWWQRGGEWYFYWVALQGTWNTAHNLCSIRLKLPLPFRPPSGILRLQSAQRPSSRCWKSWLTQFLFLTLFQSENGPKKFISHVLLQSSLWILFRVMYMLFARHLFWRWFCIATLRLWSVKWQLNIRNSCICICLGCGWLARSENSVSFGDFDPLSDRVTTRCHA